MTKCPHCGKTLAMSENWLAHSKACRGTQAMKAELYDHILEVAKANGFDCLTAAIVDGVKYRKLRALGENVPAKEG